MMGSTGLQVPRGVISLRHLYRACRCASELCCLHLTGETGRQGHSRGHSPPAGEVGTVACNFGNVTALAMKRKLPSSGTMNGVEMLTASTPFITELYSVALVVRDGNDNG